ncbi:autophagy protein 7 [Pelomyxa schiedti]|nr:autophagy protein 7 [Pelomyxa schiedti]
MASSTTPAPPPPPATTTTTTGGGGSSSMLRHVGMSGSYGVTFWHQLGKHKLDVMRLSEQPLPLVAKYATPSPSSSYATSETQSQRCELSMDYSSFEAIASEGDDVGRGLVYRGTLYNANTQVGFKEMKKAELFAAEANKIFEDIKSGAALRDTTLLNRFLIVTYADLKKYHFSYMLGVPAIRFDSPSATQPTPASDPATNISIPHLVGSPVHLSALLSAPLTTELHKKYWSPQCRWPFFVVKVSTENPESLDVLPLSSLLTIVTPNTPLPPSVWVAFVDPSGMKDNPGWPLRNLLVLLAVQFHLRTVKILCYRDQAPFAETSQSVVIEISLPPPPEVANAVGWEPHPNGKIQPQFVSLSESMDPIKLATTAVDLNLKLVRWRMFPELDLNMLANTRCLLLGAGTLGCNVARTLMGWGIRKITFVDNAQVSYSNPVRQSLFGFNHCTTQTWKAKQAAESLMQIFPGMVAEGIVMNIPMPGHPVVASTQGIVQEACSKLAQLVKDHDVVFLLGDSREMRWLPSLLCAAENKIAITAGLGFDSFVVVRHGVIPREPSPRLGCYFCSDVVAPRDSMTDRTLDQTCTVTRPGISMVASAMAVELLISLLHHPLKAQAPGEERDATSMGLGSVPHQLRGFLSQWNILTLTGFAYSKCPACSPIVIEEYQKRGFEFLLQVFNQPTYLEELTGLNKLSEEHDWISEENDDF